MKEKIAIKQTQTYTQAVKHFMSMKIQFYYI